jgi:hypothetical protein
MAFLTRGEILNRILSLFEKPHYLEIGVETGTTFFSIKAERKVAVDPRFRFGPQQKNLADKADFHEVGSDVYFGKIVAPGDRFDVVYLDGLHTVEQTLRDFCNAIEYLKPRGVIVIDDVVPNSYYASLPDQQMASRVRAAVDPWNRDLSWMGDVYRLVFFIQSFFQQYRYATIIDNHGQLVVWRDRRDANEIKRRGLEAVGSVRCEAIVNESEVYNKLPFSKIMAMLTARPTSVSLS